MDELRRLFNAAVDAALGEPLEALMQKHARAVERGDWERVRALDEMLRLAVTLGTHAVIGSQLTANNT